MMTSSRGPPNPKPTTDLNQGRTSNGILIRAAQIAYFDLSKPNLAQPNVLNAFESQLQ